MTAFVVKKLIQEIRARISYGTCASCSTAQADIEIFLLKEQRGSEATLALSLPDGCTHIGIDSPGKGCIRLSTTLELMLLFLAGERSPLELLLSRDWSLEVRDSSAPAVALVDRLALRLAPSQQHSIWQPIAPTLPSVHIGSCPVLSISDVARTYSGLFLPPPWQDIPAFDPCRALDGLDRTSGQPRSFALPLSPGLRLLGPFQTVLPETNRVLGAAQRLACGVGSPELASVWHSDQADNLLAVLSGSKEVHLLPPHSVDPLHVRMFARTIDNVEWWLRTDESPVNVDHLRVMVANAGDVVFIPKGWFHNVVNRTATLAVTNWLIDTSAGDASR